MVAFRYRPGAHSGKIRPGLRFSQIHGSSPFAGHQVRQIGVFLRVRAMAHQRRDHACREHRAQTERHVRRVPHLRGLRGKDVRQTLSAVLRIAIQSGPAAFGKLFEGFGKSGCGGNGMVDQLRAHRIAPAIQRVEHAGGELPRFFEYGIDHIRREILATRQPGNVVETNQFLDREFHVADWRCVGGHTVNS